MPVASLWPLPPVIVPVPRVGPVIDYGEADFLAAMSAILPRGRAWPRDPDTVQMKLWSGLARARARVHALETRILAEAFPATTYQLLPEWEASVGLPDPCIGNPATVGERQALLLARLKAHDGADGALALPALAAAAATLGITVEFTEFADARVGQAVAGQPLYGASRAQPYAWARAGDRVGVALADWSRFTPAGDWAFALQITAVAGISSYAVAGDFTGVSLADWSESAITTVSRAMVGSRVGDPLAQWGNAALECTLRRLLPAHVVPIFAYSASYTPH